MRSRIGPLQRFARRLKFYLGGILTHCGWLLRTNLIEGISKKIKVIN